MSGCIFLEDFSEYKAGPAQDAGAQDSGTDGGGSSEDSAVDSGNDADTDSCAAMDCSDLDSECGVGACVKGKCVVQPITAMDGKDCKADKCTVDPVCDDGRCKGQAVDCSDYDSDCTKGVCDPSDGACTYENINEDGPCFDSDPCLVNEVCQAGACEGEPKDCTAFDDACNVGTCDENSGSCYDEPANEGDLCDDENDCTESDECNADGDCVGLYKADTEACDDGDPCTEKNHCDGSGLCVADALADIGTPCDDGSICTANDTCDALGECVGGTAVNEGEPCWVGCETNDICENGVCVYTAESEIVSTCQYFWCDPDFVCKDAYNGDGYCDCGCGYDDVDCSDCSMWMCLSFTNPAHEGRAWCDAETGKAVDDCPESFKNDGKCDCGCQFVDPDCEGGSCCGATGEKGCDNEFVEACVCEIIAYPKPECCEKEWTAECAQYAKDYGCAVCP